jgi:hypothetical protein
VARFVNAIPLSPLINFENLRRLESGVDGVEEGFAIYAQSFRKTGERLRALRDAAGGYLG